MSKVLDLVSQIGIVPLVVLENKEDAVPLGKALVDGGIPIAEVTFRTDAALDVIKEMCKVKGLCVGAGTVHNLTQAKDAVAAGATFIVSPGINVEVVKWCNEKNIPILPGIVSPTDVELALSLGLSNLKFFPAENYGGIKTLKALSGPFSKVKFLPTGGVTEENYIEYLNLPNVLAVGGSFIMPSQYIKAKEWNKIAAKCKELITKKHGFRVSHFGINTASKEKANTAALLFSKLFGFEVDERVPSYFASPEIEIMNSVGLGKCGHIGIKCNNVESAMTYLKGLGVEFLEDTFRFDEKGRVKFAYLKDEIAGFAVHIM